MASLTVTCGFCRRQHFAQAPTRGRAAQTQILAALYQAGWTGSIEHGRWACSDDCRAFLARDVTPKSALK